MKIRIVVFNAFTVMCLNYVGDPLLESYKFDAELVDPVCSKMKRGKAAGIDELTIEHVVCSLWWNGISPQVIRTLTLTLAYHSNHVYSSVRTEFSPEKLSMREVVAAM